MTKNIHKSIKIAYQIYAAIFLQINIEKKLDTDSFEICADYGASSCAAPNEIDFIPGTYKFLTGVTINVIAEGIKVTGCGSVSWILMITRRRILNLLLNKFSIFQACQFGSFSCNKLQNKLDTLLMDCT